MPSWVRFLIDWTDAHGAFGARIREPETVPLDALGATLDAAHALGGSPVFHSVRVADTPDAFDCEEEHADF